MSELIIDPTIVSRNNDGTVNILDPVTGKIVVAESVIAYRILTKGDDPPSPGRCIQ